MPEGMLFIGRAGSNADGNHGDDDGKKVEEAVNGLGDDAETARP
jgi:hypothetical protein